MSNFHPLNWNDTFLLHAEANTQSMDEQVPARYSICIQQSNRYELPRNTIIGVFQGSLQGIGNQCAMHSCRQCYVVTSYRILN